MSEFSGGTARYETSIAGWSFAIARTLADYGFAPGEVFSAAGIELDKIATPCARLPVNAVQQVWQFANTHTDGCFGVRMSRHITPASLHALGFALCCSSTMKEFFERYIRYRCVLSHLHFCELVAEDDYYRLSLVDERKIKSEITNDAACGYFLNTARMIGDRNFAPRAMSITRRLGAERNEIEAFFNADIEQQAAAYTLDFNRDDLEAPLQFANPPLAAQQDAIVERYIAENELISEYMLRVRTAIQQFLIEGTVCIEKVADHLHVSVRTLQRRLADEASSYNQLLDQVRKQLAIEFCKARGATATEIAFRLGFTDSGSFGRCFRRWTGQSFTSYRQRGGT